MCETVRSEPGPFSRFARTNVLTVGAVVTAVTLSARADRRVTSAAVQTRVLARVPRRSGDRGRDGRARRPAAVPVADGSFSASSVIPDGRPDVAGRRGRGCGRGRGRLFEPVLRGLILVVPVVRVSQVVRQARRPDGTLVAQAHVRLDTSTAVARPVAHR